MALKEKVRKKSGLSFVFLQLLTAGSWKLHKMASSLVTIQLIPTFYDFPAMRDLHFLDQVSENVEQMEHGVEPTLPVKVRTMF